MHATRFFFSSENRVFHSEKQTRTKKTTNPFTTTIMPPHASNNHFFVVDCDDYQQYAQTNHKYTTVTSKPLAPKARRTITFAPYDEVNEIIHINDLQRITDIDTLWYTKSEYSAMRSDIKSTVAALEKKQALNSDQCGRGLEHKTTLGRQGRKQRIVWAQYAVFA